MADAKSGSGKKSTSVRSVVEDVEKTGEAMLVQVKEQFETLGHRMSAIASSMADTATSVTESQMGSEVAEFLARAMHHVREAGEATAESISEGFDLLHKRTRAATAKKKAKKKAAKKKAAKKKAKKKATKKKAAKKKPAKKKATKKRAKKKAKKKVSKKKATRKKTRR